MAEIKTKEQATEAQAAYQRAVEAIKELRGVASHESCLRALSAGTKETAERSFADHYGVKLSDSPCIHRLCGRACGISRQRQCDCGPPGNDHGSLWLKNGKPFMFVSQPYTIGIDALAEVMTFAEANGLEVEICTERAFYAPGLAFMILWRRKGWRNVAC